MHCDFYFHSLCVFLHFLSLFWADMSASHTAHARLLVSHRPELPASSHAVACADTHAWTTTCTRTHTHTTHYNLSSGTHTRNLSLSTHTRTHTHTHTHTHSISLSRTHARTHTRARTHTCTHTHIHTRAHAHTHTHTHRSFHHLLIHAKQVERDHLYSLSFMSS